MREPFIEKKTGTSLAEVKFSIKLGYFKRDSRQNRKNLSGRSHEYAVVKGLEHYYFYATEKYFERTIHIESILGFEARNCCMFQEILHC